MSRVWKMIVEREIGSHAHHKYPAPALGNTIFLGVEDCPFDMIPGETKSAELILEQLTIATVNHPINVFDDECLWQNISKCSVKLAI
jgi:hypothetical protein